MVAGCTENALDHRKRTTSVTTNDAGSPRSTTIDDIEAEATALLEQAGVAPPKKTRARKSAAADAPETTAESPEEAPAPKPRARRKAAEDAPAVPEPAAKPRARRKSADDGAVETEPAPKRTRARKTVPEPVAEDATAPEMVAEPVRQPEPPPRHSEPVEESLVAQAPQPLTEPAAAAPAPAAEVPPGPSEDAEPEVTFSDLGLSDALLKAVRDVGYEEPTPIQLITIPAMLRGVDIIAQAQTGSGKTAAFGLPIIEQLDERDRHIQALILTPTRELAIQVAEALHKYGKHKHIETLPIYGGQPYERQFRGLQRGPQIVVGTPGRVMDHMRRGTLTLDHIRFFVLDEADEMLDMGFIEDIEWILEQAPETRQIALFSATMPPRIVELSQRYLNDPERLVVPGRQMTVPATRQISYEVPRSRKVDALTRILDAEIPPLTMIFCRTKHGVDELGEALLARGFGAETLHGDLSQAQRDRVMKRFRTSQADILVATDVAARGLDIPEVSHVINFDIPESPEAYVHRIGRTGRAGRAGVAITLVTPKEVRWLRQIERIIKAKIEPRRLPTAADVADRRREALRMQVIEVLEHEEGYTRYLDTVSALAEEHDLVEIAAAVLKLYADETGRGLTAEVKDDDVAALPTARAARSEQGMARLFLNIGRNFGVRPQDIVGAIANEANIPGRAIGAIDIMDTYSFVEVPAQFADQVIAALRRSGIKGRPVNAERAQGETAGPGRFDDRRPPGPRDGRPYDRGPRGGPYSGGGQYGNRRSGPGQGRPRDTRGPGYGGPRRPPGDRRSDW
jgi:ATP-dependent RNA helicase DeaD